MFISIDHNLRFVNTLEEINLSSIPCNLILTAIMGSNTNSYNIRQLFALLLFAPNSFMLPQQLMTLSINQF